MELTTSSHTWDVHTCSRRDGPGQVFPTGPDHVAVDQLTAEVASLKHEVARLQGMLTNNADQLSPIGGESSSGLEVVNEQLLHEVKLRLEEIVAANMGELKENLDERLLAHVQVRSVTEYLARG